MNRKFFDQVYALVECIPAGKVMTYGQIAQALASPYSAKLVGFAMSGAPAGRGLPCHRVVNRMGEMAPGLIFGGPDAQRALLESEGTPFLANGKIDLSQARFEPDSELLAELCEGYTEQELSEETDASEEHRQQPRQYALQDEVQEWMRQKKKGNAP